MFAPGWIWEDLLRTASDESVLPVLHSRFMAMALLDELPVEVADFLLAVEEANRERNRSILEELRAVCAVLNGIGIQPVLLKGLAYLAAEIYSDPGHRFLMDIDVLVPEERRESAVEALTRQGWVADESDPFRDFRHHAPPLRRQSSVWIEVHHSVGTGVCESILPAREAIARSLPFRLGDLDVRLPSKEDLATHLILHSQLQHSPYYRIWPPVKAMADLLFLERRFGPALDWECVAARFSRARQSRVLELHLCQVQHSLGMSNPLPGSERPASRFLWFRRTVLRRQPVLRYLDPSYMLSVTLARRLVTLRRMLSSRCGRRRLVAQVLSPANYVRFWADLVHGRGR